MSYYQFLPGQVAKDWLAVETFFIAQDGCPCLLESRITIKPKQDIPNNAFVSEAWYKELKKDYNFRKLT